MPSPWSILPEPVLALLMVLAATIVVLLGLLLVGP